MIRKLATFGAAAAATLAIAGSRADDSPGIDNLSGTWENAATMIAHGRATFRFDNFGNEDFWGGALRLHEAIAGAANGGVGPGVSPETALAVGLKVDSQMLP